VRLLLVTASDVVGKEIKEGGKKSKPTQLYTPLEKTSNPGN